MDFNAFDLEADANLAGWSQLDMVDLKGFHAVDHFDKKVNSDGTFSITTQHETDTRFEVASGRPKTSIADQNGIRVVGQADTFLFDLLFGGAVLSQLPGFSATAFLAKIGNYPSFQIPTSAELSEWSAEGWTISSQIAQKITLTRTDETMEIFLPEHQIRVNLFENGQSVLTIETFYSMISGKYLPVLETQTKNLTLSNGDCARCVTTTKFTNYVIEGTAPPRSSENQTRWEVAKLAVLPNPVSHEMTVVLPQHEGEVQVWVVNQIGQITQKQVGDFGETVQINTADLKAGVYFLTVCSKYFKKTIRFSKI